MTTRFTILVTASPYSRQGHTSALAFARAVIVCGHNIDSIFFHGDAVYVASELNSPPTDEKNITFEWQLFAQQHNVELSVCIGASLRRGICDKETASQEQLNSSNLATEFRLDGLGNLAQATANSDRLIRFGG
ncbi:MAG: tRNA 2-thiouridine synthesizing protein D [Enterobacterales bacterium]|jgi:tRNA 2-thiouridine synthesizing protein D